MIECAAGALDRYCGRGVNGAIERECADALKRNGVSRIVKTRRSRRHWLRTVPEWAMLCDSCLTLRTFAVSYTPRAEREDHTEDAIRPIRFDQIVL